LKEEQAAEGLSDTFDDLDLEAKRVLVITPDNTRSGPMPMIFRLMADSLLPRVKKLDFLVALGTHQPLSLEAINRLYGISEADRKGRCSGIDVYNHLWDRPDTFRRAGTIPAKETERLSNGVMSMEVPVALNRLVFDYDRVIIYGPVFPHEVAGFSGGNKYLFPGVAASDIINLTHWLGALVTNRGIIGKQETPVRAVIERAADVAGLPVTGVCSVVEGDGLAGLFAGDIREAWRSAAGLSAKKHVKWVERTYKKVISVMPEMYTDLWVGAKGMYKVEPVVEDGGEVVIFAPHIKEVSYSHGKILDRIGYHVRDYFVKQWDKFRKLPWGVLAHSTHLKGQGTFENGIEKPRIKVTLATGIAEERCKKINLGYADPKSMDITEWEARENEGILVVRNAGEILYRLGSEREGRE